MKRTIIGAISLLFTWQICGAQSSSACANPEPEVWTQLVWQQAAREQAELALHVLWAEAECRPEAAPRVEIGEQEAEWSRQVAAQTALELAAFEQALTTEPLTDGEKWSELVEEMPLPACLPSHFSPSR